MTTGFCASPDGARWHYQGELTFASAGDALDASTRLPLPTSGVIDCGGMAALDSTAVAVLLALQRRAAAENKSVTFTQPAPSLRALADLYDVTEILGFPT